MSSAVDSPVESRPTKDTAHQKAWYWYDWANSAYVTTTLTVLMAPYLTVIAKKSACPTLPSDVACHTNLNVIGIPVDPGSLVFYALTFSTIVSAVVLIFVVLAATRQRQVSAFGLLLAGVATNSVCSALILLVQMEAFARAGYRSPDLFDAVVFRGVADNRCHSIVEGSHSGLPGEPEYSRKVWIRLPWPNSSMLLARPNKLVYLLRNRLCADCAIAPDRTQAPKHSCPNRSRPFTTLPNLRRYRPPR
jgi:hypothetical protein